MKTTRTNGLGGFTLVEIMIVVAIIGLLAAIAIPNMLKASARSNSTICINNLRQIDTAIQEFSITAGKHVGDIINYPSDLTPYIKLNHNGVIPPCPIGGTYAANPVGMVPSATCSIGTAAELPHVQE